MRTLHTRTESPAPASPIQEIFSYDSLDRLKTWDFLSLLSLHPPRPPKTLSTQILNYDDIGNLKARSTQAGTGPQLVYKYGENGAGPHAVTSVNSDSYAYNDGNQISGPGRTVAYKAFNLPAS